MRPTKQKLLSLYMAAMMMSGAGFSAGRTRFSDDGLNDRDRYKGRGFSGGQSIMRKFVINGVEIMATDKTMAKKKYKLRSEQKVQECDATES